LTLEYGSSILGAENHTVHYVILDVAYDLLAR
jgi:hypothetical protein